MKATVAKVQPATRTIIRAQRGFAAVEELAWQAERSTDSAVARLFYRRMARTARSFHVQLNLADQPGPLLLPDPSPESCPSNLWHDMDRAARELDVTMPCPAITLVELAVQGSLDCGRIELAEGHRSIVGVPTVKLTTEEREWIETHEPAIEEEPIATEPATTPPQKKPEPQAAGTNDYAAVLRSMHRGKIRRVMKIWQISEATGLACQRIRGILRQLERAGRVQELEGNRWLIVDTSQPS